MQASVSLFKGLVLALAMASPALAAPDFEGTWVGPLTNLPGKPGAAAVEVTAEIGPWPARDGDCATWRNTYREAGIVKGVKDYKLCRGTGPDDLFVDEGGGVKLAARLLGDVLVSPFKYDDILLVTTTRRRGDVLEEEILSVGDQPAIKGIVPLAARNLQRLVLTKR